MKVKSRNILIYLLRIYAARNVQDYPLIPLTIDNQALAYSGLTARLIRGNLRIDSRYDVNLLGMRREEAAARRCLLQACTQESDCMERYQLKAKEVLATGNQTASQE